MSNPSYQVIARKWRPQDFQELVGQKPVTQTLANALKSGRLAHALILTGPRGTGKTSTARILAKSLRCSKAVDFVPCNQCSECDEINLGRSLNVIEIDGASNNGVEAIRELRESVGFRASSGVYKVYIIDEVHMLSTSAFNALLKTLEEPPSHVVFVLATTEIHKVPNTILSRCQRLDFRRISTREIVERLQLICSAEGVSITPEALWLVARQAEGSLRDSQSLLDQLITYSDHNVTVDRVIEVLGLTDRALLLEAVRALVARDVNAILELLKKLWQAGAEAKLFVQDLLEMFRHLLLIKVASIEARQIVDLPDSEFAALVEQAALLSAEDIHFLFDMALKGANDIPRAQDPHLVLEVLLLRMSVAPRVQNLAELLAPTPASSSAPNPAPNLAPNSAPMPAALPSAMPPAMPSAKTGSALPKTQAGLAAPPQPAGETSDRWAQWVQRVTGHNALLGAKLAHTRVKAIEPGSVRVLIPSSMKFIYDQLTGLQFKEQLAKYLREYWEPNTSLHFELEGADEASAHLTPQQLGERQKAEREAALRREVQKHPLVQSVEKVFKTEIKAIRERP